jgi:putative membrane protein
MYVEKKYGFWRTFNWSKKPFIVGTLYSAAICSLIYFLEIETIIPWQPITLIGIAVAFYLGFKNNSSYDRTWEARKIWGSMVNNSRTFGAATVAFV